MPKTPLPPDATPFQRLARFVFMGYEIIAWMLMVGLLGLGLDWLIGTKPYLMAGGLALGLALGVIKFLRDAMRLTTRKAPEHPTNPERD